MTPPSPLRITVWNEARHEKKNEKVRAVYPQGIHAAIAQGLTQHLASGGGSGGGSAVTVRTATLDDPEHGLSADILAQTDVLIWWGHIAHAEVSDAVVERVKQRVLNGMGLVVLHSAHFSKIFKSLMGTGCGLKWREADELERIWVVNPGHPIADGLSEFFELPHEEMYGEFFDVPAPDELILLSWFEGGDVFRTGCTWCRGKGTIFYFRPGHETYPTYFDPNVRRVIANAVKFVAPKSTSPYIPGAPNSKIPLSPISR